MAIERIGNVSGLPVVGRYYLVPCVKVVGWKRDEWWPVIGVVHEDYDHLQVRGWHYHYDFRFVSERLYRSHNHRPIDGLAMGTVLAADSRDWATYFPVHAEGEVDELRRRCYRQMPEFTPGLCRRLEPVYKHARVNPVCARCPHRGLPLSGLPVDEEGNVVCSGHGLKWNLETGKLVSRL